MRPSPTQKFDKWLTRSTPETDNIMITLWFQQYSSLLLWSTRKESLFKSWLNLWSQASNLSGSGFPFTWEAQIELRRCLFSFITASKSLNLTLFQMKTDKYLTLSPQQNSGEGNPPPSIQKGRTFVKAGKQTREWSRQRGTSVILCLTNSSVYWGENLFQKIQMRLIWILIILVFGDLSKFRLAPFAISRQRCKNSTCSCVRTILVNLS